MFLFGGAIDESLSHLFLLRRDALRAIENVKDIHALNGQKPLEAGDRKDEEQDEKNPNTKSNPTPPAADLDVCLPGEPKHPRQRREQQQQVKGMGELEMHF